MPLFGPDATSHRIGLIIGSQRKPRCGDQIADFVLRTIKSHLVHEAADGQITFEIIDVATLGLPLFDEPGVPAQIKNPSDYTHEHTRAWSRRIDDLDAFVFVTPQYNWGVPAGLKNAIDYLFNEWKGKPAMIVSYGGHGGDKCAAALKVVLGGGVDMKVVEETVNLSFPGKEFLYNAASGKDLGLDSTSGNGTWSGERANIINVWDKMLQSL